MTLLTTAQAAAQARVWPHTIRDWKRRGLLDPALIDATGHPWYAPEDVTKAERLTRGPTRRRLLAARASHDFVTRSA